MSVVCPPCLLDCWCSEETGRESGIILGRGMPFQSHALIKGHLLQLKYYYVKRKSLGYGSVS